MAFSKWNFTGRTPALSGALTAASDAHGVLWDAIPRSTTSEGSRAQGWSFAEWPGEGEIDSGS
jgi:hypothetical protein